MERLTGLLREWISEKGLSRTYPHAIRLKEEVTTEFGVRYYTVVNEEGRVLKLKTNELIMAEDIWFMIGRNDMFPIDPVLVKKYWQGRDFRYLVLTAKHAKGRTDIVREYERT